MTNTNPDAAPSARSLEIAESVEHHWKCNPSYGVPDPCGPRCDRFNTALDIDSAIKAAVDAERAGILEVLELEYITCGYSVADGIDRAMDLIRAMTAREGGS